MSSDGEEWRNDQQQQEAVGFENEEDAMTNDGSARCAEDTSARGQQPCIEVDTNDDSDAHAATESNGQAGTASPRAATAIPPSHSACDDNVSNASLISAPLRQHESEHGDGNEDGQDDVAANDAEGDTVEGVPDATAGSSHASMVLPIPRQIPPALPADLPQHSGRSYAAASWSRSRSVPALASASTSALASAPPSGPSRASVAALPSASTSASTSTSTSTSTSDEKSVYRHSAASTVLFASAQRLSSPPQPPPMRPIQAVAVESGAGTGASTLPLPVSNTARDATATGNGDEEAANDDGTNGPLHTRHDTMDQTDGRTTTSSLSGQSSNAVAHPGAVAVQGMDAQASAVTASVTTRQSQQDVQTFDVHYDEEDPSEQQTQTTILEAIRVDESEERPLAYAKAIRGCTSKRYCQIVIGIIGAIAILGVGVTLGIQRGIDLGSGGDSEDPPGVGVDNDKVTPPPMMAPGQTINTIMKRGRVVCGVQEDLRGFSAFNATTQTREGFEVDLCKALAAGLFGTHEGHYEVKVVASLERWTALATYEIDVVTRTTTHTMERSVYHAPTKRGYTFSTPYLHDGLQINGKPPFTSCAENFEFVGECKDLNVCSFVNSTHYDTLRLFFPSTKIVVGEADDRVDNFVAGECNVIAGTSHEVSDEVIRSHGYNGSLEYGRHIWTKEPLCMVTRENDSEWSSYVDAILQGLMAAAEMGVTQSTASSFPKSVWHIRDFDSMYADAVASVGNYLELYSTNIRSAGLAKRMNAINSGTGMLYALPHGYPEQEGPRPAEGSKLNAIQVAQKLRCGMMTNQTSLGEGFCLAIAAGIFSDVPDARVEWVWYEAHEELLLAVSNGEVDVAMDVPVSAEAAFQYDITFSSPYFFPYDEEDGGVSLDGNGQQALELPDHDRAVGLAASNSDRQFAKFCFWIMTAPVISEEDELPFNDMVLVGLFGSSYKRMFRDAVLFVGDYSRIYESYEILVGPRRGRNFINLLETRGPQHLPLLFGSNVTSLVW